MSMHPSKVAVYGLALVLTSYGCPGEIPEVHMAEPKKASSVDDVLAHQEGSTVPTFIYSPVGKRDPFYDKQSIAKQETTKVFVAPIAGGKTVRLTPLQQVEIDQFHLLMTNTATSSPMAVLGAPGGASYQVHIGDFVGKNWGKITRIGREELVITETIREVQTGKVYPVTIPLVMTKSEQDKQREEMVGQLLSGSGAQ